MISLWIIDRDALLCHDGAPFVLMLDQAPKGAISLGFGETHQAHYEPTAPLDPLPVTHALDAQIACDLGLIFPYGDGYDGKSVQNLRAVSFRELLNLFDQSTLHIISRAIMLVQWQNDHAYCSRCGTMTINHAQGERAKVCPKCRHHAYPRVQPCVITAITRTHPQTGKPQILLALHHRHRTNGVYGLIAGFVEVGETLEMAAKREAFEEVGVRIDQLEYIHSQPWPYPSNLMAGFIARFQSGEIRVQAGEISDAKFFDLDDLPSIPKAGTIAHELIQHVIARHS